MFQELPPSILSLRIHQNNLISYEHTYSEDCSTLELCTEFNGNETEVIFSIANQQDITRLLLILEGFQEEVMCITHAMN